MMMKQSVLAIICMVISALSGIAHAQAPAPLTGLTNPSLAFGLQFIRDWNTIQPFINLAHVMRPWIGKDQKGQRLKHEQLKDLGAFDQDGWVKSIPAGVGEVFTALRWGNTDAGASENAGDYVLTYDGEGDVHIRQNAHVAKQSPGRIEFSISSVGIVHFVIKTTDPRGTGDYIRNIVITRKEDQDLLKAGAMFAPRWLELVQDARQVRFMNWQMTNNSTETNWRDRAKLSDATWSGDRGVPAEVMVRLANEIGADPWFTMPFGADDDYIRRFASLVRDTLDPRLQATVEYSNEIWNWGFDQRRQLQEIADSDPAQRHPATIAGARAHHVLAIWADVFGEQNAHRLVRAFGVQTTGTHWTKKALAAIPDAPTRGSSKTVADGFDALAITSYFGGGEEIAKLAQHFTKRGGYWHDDLTRLLRRKGAKRSIPDIRAAIKKQSRLAKAAGLKLIKYEGGQHLHAQRIFKLGGDTFDAQIAEYVNSPQMGELYADMWRVWHDLGDGPFMHFTATGQSSRSGSWGLYQNSTDTNPRAQTLKRLNETTPGWWDDRAGALFQQGFPAGARQQIGTDEEDYLIGGPSDEVFFPHKGNDGIYGGDGYDVVHVANPSSDYEITSKNGVHIANGSEGIKTLTAVEAIQFGDGKVVELAQ